MTKYYSNTDLFHVEFKWSTGLALGTCSRLDFLLLVLIERTENEAALDAVILNNTQLWHYTRTAHDHTARTYQLVQMQLPTTTTTTTTRTTTTSTTTTRTTTTTTTTTTLLLHYYYYYYN